jgi:hypothetical protein
MADQPDDVDVPPAGAEHPPELGRRQFLGKAAGAAVAAVAAPALLGACDSGSTPTEASDGASVRAPATGPSLSSGVGLPPWYIVHEKIAATIGAASNVKVPALARVGTYAYLQNIITDDSRVGSGLATIVRGNYDFVDSYGRKIVLSVQVVDSRGTRHPARTILKQSDLVYAMKDALASNTLADGVLRDSLTSGKPIIAVFKSSMIGFQASAASDYYGNWLQVTSRAASDIFNPSVGGYPITATIRDLNRC